MTPRRHSRPVNPNAARRFGPELHPHGGARFRLWAPAARTVALRFDRGPTVAMTREAQGWFTAGVDGVTPGTRYWFQIDDTFDVPDPASRFQPEGLPGPSELIDLSRFAWRDAAWRGRAWEDTVLYELHVGAFTERGDYAGVVEQLDELAALGITALELMPLAECPGARNWGYDGVLPFAPASRYGRPEELMRLVDEAHRRGLMVFLDVVYNHFGPAGNDLGRYAPAFFTTRYQTPWGAAIDFEGAQNRPVREFFIENALHWIRDYHLDGLRLDAVHAIADESPTHILDELADRVHAEVGGERAVHLVLENDRNEVRWLERRPDRAPPRYAAQWNDDFHHALHSAITGEHTGYYADYADRPAAHLARALAEGFAYQGDASPHRGGARRGVPSRHLPPTAFVNFLQNHDQIGNRAFGQRLELLAPADAVRAGVAILLLAPSIPLLFMGEEWACEQPFVFFCDFADPELSARVREGRRREFQSFPEFADPAAREEIPDPTARASFAASTLRWGDAQAPEARARRDFYRELLTLRQREITPRLPGMRRGSGAFETFGEAGIWVSWKLGDGAQLTLRATLSAGVCAVRPQLSDTPALFFVSSDPSAAPRDAELPPWTVAWFLDA